WLQHQPGRARVRHHGPTHRFRRHPHPTVLRLDAARPRAGDRPPPERLRGLRLRLGRGRRPHVPARLHRRRARPAPAARPPGPGRQAPRRGLPEDQLPARPGRGLRRARTQLLPGHRPGPAHRDRQGPPARRHRDRPADRRRGDPAPAAVQPPRRRRRARAVHRARARRARHTRAPARQDPGPGARHPQGRDPRRQRAGHQGPRMRVAIVGGGITGLATAALLAGDGHAVELFESRDDLGGRAGSWAADGFRFDTGPSWFLMPEVFEHFYRLLGTSTGSQLDLVRLDPGYRVFFESGADPIDLGGDPELSLEIFEAIEPGSRDRMERYLASARETYRLAIDHFLYDDFSSLSGLLRSPVLGRAHRLVRLLGQPLASYAAGTVRDPRLQQVLGYPAVFLGTSPYRAPSMYHLMSHLDLEDGVYYPMGGFAAVVDGVACLAQERGAVLRTGTPVSRITVSGGVATGVEVADGAGGTRHV